MVYVVSAILLHPSLLAPAPITSPVLIMRFIIFILLPFLAMIVWDMNVWR